MSDQIVQFDNQVACCDTTVADEGSCCVQPVVEDTSCCEPSCCGSNETSNMTNGLLNVVSNLVYQPTNGRATVQSLFSISPIAQKQVSLPVAIIGGGPVGLAVAAHLQQRGESFVLFEAGETVGASIWSWRHVRLFSPWQYCVDTASVALLQANGWQMPNPESLPTGGELVERYLRPLAGLPELEPHIKLGSRVTFVGRKGLDKMKTAERDEHPFVLHVEEGGKVKRVEAKAVIDASGTWDNPNPLGSGGVSALGEAEAHEQILYGIPDVLGRHRTRYANKRIMVVGSGHSAMNALLELAELKATAPATEIYWAIRKKQMYTVYGGGADDALPARGALGTRLRDLVEQRVVNLLTPFYIHQIEQEKHKLQVTGMLGAMETTVAEVDQIITSTGSRPDLSFLREVRVQVDAALECVPALAPLIDPNLHSCGTVRPHGEQELRQMEKDFYVVGMKSYGRAPTFLLATGYEQARSVVAGLVGDWEAAQRVELNLPETGVCNTNLPTNEASNEAGCCGTGVNVSTEGLGLIELKVQSPALAVACW